MELEDELGKQLFVRRKRKVTLTEDGILLSKRTEKIAFCPMAVVLSHSQAGRFC